MANLVTEDDACCTVGNDHGFRVVVDELEVFGACPELEEEQLAHGFDLRSIGPALQNVPLVG